MKTLEVATENCLHKSHFLLLGHTTNIKSGIGKNFRQENLTYPVTK